MNSLRIIYLDGRPHSDPDIVVPSFNGESIGRWEGNTLVVDTKYFPGHHHWMDQAGVSDSGKRSVAHRRTHADAEQQYSGNRIHDVRFQKLGGRLEDDQALESCE
jgi:hypothetical protein